MAAESGGANHKMSAVGGGARHKMSESEVIHNSPEFQAEGLFNWTPLKNEQMV